MINSAAMVNYGECFQSDPHLTTVHQVRGPRLPPEILPRLPCLAFKVALEYFEELGSFPGHKNVGPTLLQVCHELIKSGELLH